MYSRFLWQWKEVPRLTEICWGLSPDQGCLRTLTLEPWGQEALSPGSTPHPCPVPAHWLELLGLEGMAFQWPAILALRRELTSKTGPR